MKIAKIIAGAAIAGGMAAGAAAMSAATAGAAPPYAPAPNQPMIAMTIPGGPIRARHLRGHRPHRHHRCGEPVIPRSGMKAGITGASG